MTHDDIPGLALQWHRDGRGAVLATVINTWGSAPRPVGSQLVVSGRGEIMGSVSGGCVEGAVILEAQEALAEGRPRKLSFGVSDADAFAVGLACGGTIEVMVDPVGSGLPEAMLADLVEARRARKGVVLEVDLAGWNRTLRPATAGEIRDDRSLTDGDLFRGIHSPPLRMIVVGAVHIAQPLVQMARLAGHDPVLIDPREVFGAAARFPGETILDLWPDEALAQVGPDARSAVVTLTHDPKLDDPAIIAALESDAYYIGCLGSRRTHAQRVARLEAAGIGADQIGRIHAPVGLAIGAKSPSEIAVSIMAQIIQVLRQE